MTHSYVWRDSFVCARIHAWHESFICVWIYVCNTPHVMPMWDYSFIRVTWLVRMCANSCVTWIIHKCADSCVRHAHAYVWWLIHTTWLVCMCANSCVTWVVYMCADSCVWHASHIGVMTLSDVWRDSFAYALIHVCDITHAFVKWLIYICDITHSYTWWRIHMCDMIHSYVCHNSFTGGSQNPPPTLAPSPRLLPPRIKFLKNNDGWGTYGTQIIHMCHTTHSRVTLFDSFICVMTVVIHSLCPIPMVEGDATILCHEWFPVTSSFIWDITPSPDTWLIHIQHDSFI